ncbi:efflux RND transporter periplasmic adaptor subunit [Marinagarivorans algicola]|uniref:efflux RND transporter periplasmic adaptor subunit n=1 Tax=Marinagarivorans algicola TaxID=1513270 RepID=UPI001EE3B14D|nr:efflux RND transporter periplasmic adaptor subunit [Marinagarivorans algicola]
MRALRPITPKTFDFIFCCLPWSSSMPSLALSLRSTQSFRQFAALALLVMTALYCIPKAAAAPAPPTVDVMTMQPQGIRTWVKFSGRIAPVQSAIIRPLVGGTIQEVLFKDGEQVKKNQPLFIIDPRQHEASVAEAKARVAIAKSRAKLAQDELARSKKLVDDKLISQSLYDSALSAQQVAQADIKQAQAALSHAELNLEYAHIRAPIAGRVSRAELTPGNVVEAGPSAPIMTEIVATDTMYAEFNVDEGTYIEFIRNIKDTRTMPVQLTLTNNNDVVYKGHIASFDNRLDATSGTIRARALFNNSDGALTAGMFANVRLGSESTQSVLLLPTRAIGTNQSKKFVLVVDDKNTALYREVTLGEYYQQHRVVLSGLEAGDTVIVNGLSHVRPNTPVTPNNVTTANITQASTAP